MVLLLGIISVVLSWIVYYLCISDTEVKNHVIDEITNVRLLKFMFLVLVIISTISLDISAFISFIGCYLAFDGIVKEVAQ